MKKRHARLIGIVVTLLMMFTTFAAYGAPTSVGGSSIKNLSANSIHQIDQQKLKETALSEYNAYRASMMQKAQLGRKTTDDNVSKEKVLDPNKSVRLIVELNEKSVSDMTNGQSISKVSSLSSMKASVLSTQETYKAQALQKTTDGKVRQSYYLLLNGFSMDAQAKDIDSIREIPGVKKVSIANEYYPDMTSAKSLTNATKVWTDLGYKGQGIVVAIVDSGIDTTHKDMRLSDTTVPKIQKADVEVGGKYYHDTQKGQYFTPKVPYGHNFADNNNDIIDKNPGTGMHGMHVSGIVAANATDSEVQANTGIQGVAPEAQLLAMKVFSNNPAFASAFSDDIIAAIEDSVAHGADVINMSLGSPAGYVDEDSAEQDAVEKAAEQGVISVISAGNEQYSSAPYKLSSDVDTGVVGSPATAKDALMVASYENSNVTGPAIDYTAGTAKGTAYYTTSEVNPVGVLKDAAGYELVDCGKGQASDFDGKDLKGKIALIQRGVSTFIEKKQNAQAAGAVGAIIYNNAAGYINMATDPSVKIPGVFISQADGTKLQSLISSGVRVKFNGTIVSAPNALTGDMSDFTSWGPTPSLTLRPQISAPGGNIWSTVNNNSYENMSGTSMASPHTAGLMALVLQHVNKNFADLKGINKVDVAKELLINTAAVKMDPLTENKVPFSPRRQGAGLADVSAAAKNYVTATYNGEAVASLKEITPAASGNTTKTFDVVLHNYGTTSVTYTPKDLSGVLTEQREEFLQTMSYDQKIAGAAVSFDNPQVTVAPNSDATVKVTLTIPQIMDGKDVVQDIFAEGFISFESQTAGAPSIGMPYMGFYGEWDRPTIMDGPIWDYCLWGTETLLTKTSDGGYNYLGFEGLDKYSSPIINPDHIAINPKDANANNNIIPILAYLRNAKDNVIEITDKDGKVIKTVAQDLNLTKCEGKTTYLLDSAWDWDGFVYDPQTSVKEVPADGQYYVQVRNKIDYPDAKEQTFTMPFMIDSVTPDITDVNCESTGNGKYNITFKANDTGVGIDSFIIFVDGEIFAINGENINKFKADDNGVYSINDLDLGTGNHVVDVAALDYAGNLGIGEAIAANVIITSPAYGSQFDSGSFDLSFTCNKAILDSIDHFEIDANPVGNTDPSKVMMLGTVEKTKSYFRVDGMDPGKYNIYVAAIPSDPNADVTDVDVIRVIIKAQKLNLVVDNPQPGAIYGTDMPVASGKFDVMPTTFTINDKPVTVNDDLTFETSLTLTDGLNKVHFYAELKDAYGNIADKTDYSIDVYSQSTNPVLNITNPTTRLKDGTLVDYVADDAATYTIKGNAEDPVLGYRLYVNGEQILTAATEVPPATEADNKTYKEFSYDLPLTGTENNAEINLISQSGLGVKENVVIRKLQYFDVGVGFDNLTDGMTLKNQDKLTIKGHYNIASKPSLFKINGEDVALNADDDSFSKDVALNLGENTITFTAASADGKANENVSFKVTRLEDKTAPVITLTGFETSDTVTVPRDQNSYELKGTVSDDLNGYTVKVNGDTKLTSDTNDSQVIDLTLPLNYDTTTFNIEVTDSFGNSAKKVITVNKEDQFTPTGIVFDRIIDGSVYDHTLVRFTGIANTQLETFKINDMDVKIYDDKTFEASVKLNEGKNDVHVYAVTKADDQNKAVTIDTTVSVICDTTAPVINITDPVNPTVPITVPSTQSSITLKGTLNDFLPDYLTVNGAEVQVNENKFEATVNLKDGMNEIDLYAEDAIGNFVTKKVYVYKLSAADASLDSITINGNSLIGFRPDVYDYTFVVAGNTTSIPKVSYDVPVGSTKKVEITEATSLPGTTKIVVTSEDGKNVLTYNINFVKAVTIQKLSPAEDKVYLGNDAKIVISAMNNQSSDQSATLIVALYDKSTGRMITYAAANQVIAAQGSTQLLAQLPMPTAGLNYEVRCFVWDTIDGMNPLTDVITLPVAQPVKATAQITQP